MSKKSRVRKRHSSSAAPMQRRWPVIACSALALFTSAVYSVDADADVSILRPAREARSDQPLTVTVVFSGDENGSDIDVPRTVTVTLTNGEALPRPVELARASDAPEHLRLAAGDMKAIKYSAPWPEWARGAVRIDVPGVDVSPSLVMLTRVPERMAADNASQQRASASQTSQTAAQSAAADNETLAVTPKISSSPPPTNSLKPDLGTFLAGRLSPYQPTYFADGAGSHGDNLAKFQISFKFRFVLPDDPRSRGLVDNLYFAYTQTSLWDIREYSAPFRDTSYKPSLFYYLADTGWRSRWFSRMGVITGYEHESNGKAGPDSRGIDILFVQPIWDFGDVNANHLTVSPKIYWYEHKADENSNIADYRGYVDLLLKYGSPDGWQLATTLRKGMKSSYGSIDAQLTYPLAKLINSAWGGYLWLGYFNGYGEDILDFNRRHWMARIGFSVTR